MPELFKPPNGVGRCRTFSEFTQIIPACSALVKRNARATSDVQNPANAPVEHGAHPALLSQEPPVVGSFVEVVRKHRAEEFHDTLVVGGGWWNPGEHRQIPSKSAMVRYQAR